MITASSARRRATRQILIGDVPLGGNAQIAVHSMTNAESALASIPVKVAG